MCADDVGQQRVRQRWTAAQKVPQLVTIRSWAQREISAPFVYSVLLAVHGVRFKAVEIGHIHPGGIVDIPFPRSVRDPLLAEGLAQEHRWSRISRWIKFQIRGEDDFPHALWLMRLVHAEGREPPLRFLDDRSEELHLAPQLKSLFEVLIPRSALA